MADTTILVVEDDPLGRELVVEILGAAGYTVLEAEDGRGLLERVKRERPDLILLDLQLPGIDGFTLIQGLRADPATEQIPILVMSAYARPAVQAQALAAGCSGFIAKPFDTRELLCTVARVLEG